jgi:uncharacterized protein
MARRFCIIHRTRALIAAALLFALVPGFAQTPPSPRELRVYAGLHAAAAAGDAKAIEQLVADGEKPNIQDANSRTPLLVAAFGKQLAAAQALLRLGANVNAHDADGYGILAIAAKNNDIEMLKTALAAGADPRAVEGRDNGSALILASQLGFIDIVQSLIGAKADIDRVNAQGRTALVAAVALGNGDKAHTAVVEALVTARADGDVKDATGRTALDYARARGYSDMVPILEKSIGRRPT